MQFMDKLFEDGHDIELDPENLCHCPGKVWYQAHFCVQTSDKFHVVFECATRYKGINLSDYL